MLLSTAAKHNCFDTVARVFVRMQTDWHITPNEVAYTALAKACGERGDPHAAEKWISIMQAKNTGFY